MNDHILWSPGLTLEAIEKMVILKALTHFRYNKTVTAQALGIAIRTLDNKLDKYDHDKKVEEQRDADTKRKREDFAIRERGNPPNNLGIPFSPAFSPTVMQESVTRTRMESFANSSPKHEMSLQEQSEVQAVLPSKTSGNGKHRGR